MMVQRVTTTQLVEELPDLLARVHDHGERFLIVRDGQPVATLAPADDAVGITWREFARRYSRLPRPDDAFADDLAAVRASQIPIEPPEWPS
jgi:antitoxin (DNA-binding transcriptional repressor) of toxin-antitoxin stability system